MILWDGVKFFHEPDQEKANMLVDRGLAQNAGKEDGFSLAYKHQFPLKSNTSSMTYQTREIRAEQVLQAKEELADTFSEEEVKEVIEEVVEEASKKVTSEDWEDYKSEYKSSTGAIRARKDAVIEWMLSEGLI